MTTPNQAAPHHTPLSLLLLNSANEQDIVTLEWLSTTPHEEVLKILHEKLSNPDILDERAELKLTSTNQLSSSIKASLSVTANNPTLTSIEWLRIVGSSPVSSTLAAAIWSCLDATSVVRLKSTEGGNHIWDAAVTGSLKSLKILNLSNCGLLNLPGMIGTLKSLEEVRLVGNKLKILPAELGKLSKLRVLAVDSNELAILPGELRHCSQLEEITLENNRLTSVLLSFQALQGLKVLHMYNNPLEFLPEIAPCKQLRHLSVANLRVTSDRAYSKFNVELLPSPSSSSSAINIPLFDNKQNDQLKPLFSLLQRRSSGHHPLLAGALRQLAEDSKVRELMIKQEGALEQLIFLALNDDEIVVEQACATLTLLSNHSATFAESIIVNESESLLRLIKQSTGEKKIHLSSLKVLGAVALASPAAAPKVFTEGFVRTLESIISSESAELAERIAALEALGNMAFVAEVRTKLYRHTSLMNSIAKWAQKGYNNNNNDSNIKTTTKEEKLLSAAAIRVLAILGENDDVARAVGRSHVGVRRPRILSLDGGGMKGMATVRLLRELESRTGKPIADLFDLIVGTSTGAMLAVALGLRRMNLDECENIYKVLGQRVFTRPMASKDKEESWMESFYRTFQTKTQHVRAVVVGCKHDTSIYESMLKEYCTFTGNGDCLSNTMIDTACLSSPKVALVSTLASVCPATPFVFRNYEFSQSAAPLIAEGLAHQGSAKHQVWEGVRASSAATYYLDEFICQGSKFQDGAVTANNPAMVALQEARLLWPEVQPELLISIGTGDTPQTKRGNSMSSFMDTGSILIESATSVRRVSEALATILPLVPGLTYHRFCSEDVRCNMELDEVDPAAWDRLEAATDEYAKEPAVMEQFDAAAAALVDGAHFVSTSPSQRSSAPATSNVIEKTQPALKLGLRKKLMVLHSQQSPARLTLLDAVAVAVGQKRECISLVDFPPLLEEGLVTKHSSYSNSSSSSTSDGSAFIEEKQKKEDAATINKSKQHTLPKEKQLQEASSLTPALQEENKDGGFSSFFGWLSPTKAQMASVAADGKDAAEHHGNNNNKATSLLAHPLPSLKFSQLAPSLDMDSGDAVNTSKSGGVEMNKKMQQQRSKIVQLLMETIEAASSLSGVLHLGLQPHGKQDGMVLQWQQCIQPVLEPSVEASNIVRRSGRSATVTSLGELFEQNQEMVAEQDGSLLTILSRQTQYIAGQQLSLYLLQKTTPAAVLDAAMIGELAHMFSGLLVVSASVMPLSVVAALLNVGVKGVVIPKPDAVAQLEHIKPKTGILLFQEFYDALQGGASVTEAIQKAEAKCPAAKGIYCLMNTRSK
jgi:Leucine-rich repeat (LRR) protein